jgi:tRNA A-37 threonylcarbamoyl transferase component Bud32
MADILDSQLLASFGVQNNQMVCDTGEVLTIVSIARVLPGQRIVCKCLFNASEVFAKIFIGQRANIHADREASGAKLLISANILTPNLLLQTTSQNLPVIVYEAIENAVNAEEFVQKADFLSCYELLKKLTQTVAQHHNAGLLQTDIHLKNFLVENEKIYTLDGDGIRQFSPLSQAQAQQNLTALWSKFDVLAVEKWQADLAETYSVAIVGHVVVEPTKLAKMANLQRLKTASSYADKKVFRQCTDVNVRETNSGLQGLFYAACSHAEMNIPKNIIELDALITLQNLLKNGNTCTVALAEISGKKIVIKRYNIKNFWHGISRAFRQSRAAKSWANAHRLQLLGIPTARPIALIEQRKFGFLKGKAYFLAEYIVVLNARESDSAPDAAQYFEQMQDKVACAEAIKNIATLFYKLYLLQISHGDMKATNIKIVDNKPVLIDLDSMHQHKMYFSSRVAHVKDLNRFMQNWQNQPALYNAFVKTFKVVYPDVAILIKAGIATNKELT